MNNRLWLLLFALFLGGCAKEVEHAVIPAFYHWRTRYDLDSLEQSALQTHQAKRIHVKYFDVDIGPQGTPEPSAKVEWAETPQLEIVPVVYLTNRSFLQSDARGPLANAEVDTLARRCAAMLHRLHPAQAPAPPEVQFDCDWTGRSRSAYFRFLRRVRTALSPWNPKLSATIRLHQYRDPEGTGTPPVDRGMVMLYNTGDLADPDEDNSILSADDLDDYLSGTPPYPIATDIALPIFAWSVVLRNGKPVHLLNNTTMEELLADSNHAKSSIPNRVEVVRNHYFRNHYLYTGDVIRAEAIAPDTLVALAERAASAIRPLPQHVALYQLDHARIQQYPPASLAAVFGAFRHPSPASTAQ